MLELSLESGVAVPTIYQYFENKEDIFVAWINRVIDNVLSQVSLLEGSLDNVDIPQYVEVLIRGGLAIISLYRESIHQLLSGVPQVLSSQVVATMEHKTVNMIEVLFAEKIAPLQQANIHFQIETLVRLITGYILQAILCDERDINIERESAELTLLVNLYLQAHNIAD